MDLNTEFEDGVIYQVALRDSPQEPWRSGYVVGRDCLTRKLVCKAGELINHIEHDIPGSRKRIAAYRESMNKELASNNSDMNLVEHYESRIAYLSEVISLHDYFQGLGDSESMLLADSDVPDDIARVLFFGRDKTERSLLNATHFFLKRCYPEARFKIGRIA